MPQLDEKTSQLEKLVRMILNGFRRLLCQGWLGHQTVWHIVLPIFLEDLSRDRERKEIAFRM